MQKLMLTVFKGKTPYNVLKVLPQITHVDMHGCMQVCSCFTMVNMCEHFLFFHYRKYNFKSIFPRKNEVRVPSFECTY